MVNVGSQKVMTPYHCILHHLAKFLHHQLHSLMTVPLFQKVLARADGKQQKHLYRPKNRHKQCPIDYYKIPPIFLHSDLIHQLVEHLQMQQGKCFSISAVGLNGNLLVNTSLKTCKWLKNLNTRNQI